MEFFGGKSVELEVLGPHVKSKEETNVGSLFTLNWDRQFERILVAKRGLSFSLDSTRQYTAMRTLVRRGEMNENWKKCFWKLLGTGVALKKTGFLSRGLAFVPSTSIDVIKAFMPEVTVDDALGKSLAGDADLMGLLARLRPDSFVVDLSFSTEGLPIGTELGSMLREPRELMWTVIVERYPSKGTGERKDFLSVLDAIDIAMKKAVDHTMRTRDEVSKGQH